MGYFSTWTERADAGVRLIAPYSVMAVLFVFNTVSLSFPKAASITAPLLLMAIYYWSIYRPALIPAWLVFTAGIMIDLLSGISTVGINALIFVLVHWVVTDQRRFLLGQSFLMIWIGFFDRECGSVVHSMAGFWAFWGGMVVASTARIFDSPGYDAISCYFDASAYNA